MALGCFGDIVIRSPYTQYSTYLRGTVSLKVLPCPELSILGIGGEGGGGGSNFYPLFGGQDYSIQRSLLGHPCMETHRAAGCGVFFGQDHTYNRGYPLMGLARDAGRAEIRAAVHIMHWSWRPTEIRIDRQATIDGLMRIEQGQSYKDLANSDLLDQAHRIWHAKGGDSFFKFTKVMAHGRGGPQQDPIHTMYNDAADRLATQGADAVRTTSGMAS